MDDITFAVCGFGRIGKRHAKIVDEYDGSKLNAIIDIKNSLVEEAKELGYSTDLFQGLEEFIENDNRESDVITVATPNGLHAPLALKALDAGYHVVIEKPMALTKSDCEKIIFKALKVNRQVFVVKQNRYSPTSVWLNNIVGDNILGDIYMVQTNCYWNRDDRYYKPGDWHGTEELDGGTLFTQFSHFIDILYWVFGDIENIKANLNNFNHRGMIEFEDSGVVHFDFQNGGVGTFNYSTSTWGKNMESSITVLGSKGSVKVGGQYMNEVEYCHVKDYEMPELSETNPPNDYGPYKGSAANHHYIIENVVNTLHGEESITTNALEGMKVVEIIENIYKQRPNNL
ncbi:Gfo/Idh/MocA family protein [Fodinibius sp. AD559]|uniref:Gfo/Idh/MocA family protein n=1 Tax=Fodinibius sp. AD559 TaxID=3424179 RepID=UPI004046D0D3